MGESGSSLSQRSLLHFCLDLGKDRVILHLEPATSHRFKVQSTPPVFLLGDGEQSLKRCPEEVGGQAYVGAAALGRTCKITQMQAALDQPPDTHKGYVATTAALRRPCFLHRLRLSM